jgi:hypothetical protein
MVVVASMAIAAFSDERAYHRQGSKGGQGASSSMFIVAQYNAYTI